MADTLEITSTFMSFGDGLFDSRNRYMRKVTSSPTLVIPDGATIVCNAETISGNQYSFWRWRVGSATFASAETNPYGKTPPSVSSAKQDVAL